MRLYGLDDRIFGRIRMTSKCWVWTGKLNHHGYGTLRTEGRTSLVHRLMYEELVGPIPEKFTIDHLCRNRACVRPEHLEAVTMAENLLRSPAAPSTINAHKHLCQRGHDTWKVKKGKYGPQRYCSVCESDNRMNRKILAGWNPAHAQAVEDAQNALPSFQERRRIRVSSGLSLASVAQSLGVTPQAVWLWEQRQTPRGVSAVKYRDWLAERIAADLR